MKYINKISGPFLDRIDIHIEVPPVNPSFKGHSNGETSDKIRKRVNRARDVQTERFKNDDIHCNARENRHIKKYCDLAKQKNLLDLAMRELNLSLPATGF
jgi:magnesium chelatase family protein